MDRRPIIIAVHGGGVGVAKGKKLASSVGIVLHNNTFNSDRQDSALGWFCSPLTQALDGTGNVEALVKFRGPSALKSWSTR